MPPVGQVFSDDQIAAVLTYIRREWGQTGTPVDAGDGQIGEGGDRGTDASVDQRRTDRAGERRGR